MICSVQGEDGPGAVLDRVLRHPCMTDVEFHEAITSFSSSFPLCRGRVYIVYFFPLLSLRGSFLPWGPVAAFLLHFAGVGPGVGSFRRPGGEVLRDPGVAAVGSVKRVAAMPAPKPSGSPRQRRETTRAGPQDVRHEVQDPCQACRWKTRPLERGSPRRPALIYLTPTRWNPTSHRRR